jgi:hypothetical protein
VCLVPMAPAYGSAAGARPSIKLARSAAAMISLPNTFINHLANNSESPELVKVSS